MDSYVIWIENDRWWCNGGGEGNAPPPRLLPITRIQLQIAREAADGARALFVVWAGREREGATFRGGTDGTQVPVIMHGTSHHQLIQGDNYYTTSPSQNIVIWSEKVL